MGKKTGYTIPIYPIFSQEKKTGDAIPIYLIFLTSKKTGNSLPIYLIFFGFVPTGEKLGTHHLFILLIIYLITWRCPQVTENKIEIKAKKNVGATLKNG